MCVDGWEPTLYGTKIYRDCKQSDQLRGEIISPVRPFYFQLKRRSGSEIVSFQTGAGVAPVDFLLVQNKLAPAASVGISIVEGEIK